MTEWVRRAHIFIRANIIEEAKDRAALIMPDINEREMFSVRLSVSGDEPPQVFGCNTALKLSHVQRWKDEFIDLNPANVTYFLLDAATNTLLATNSLTVVVNGQIWTWQDSLGDVGLVVIQPTMEI